MKQLLLAIGTAMIFGMPAIASPGFGHENIPEKSFFQSGTITGRVTNESGEPLAGVTIQVKGTTITTVSNSDGSFSIDIPGNARALVFSYVGMKGREVSVSGQN